MKTVIIGAAGFIGQALLRHLARAPHAVEGWDVAPQQGVEGTAGVQAVDVLRDEIRFPAGTEAVFYLAQSSHYRSFPAQAEHLFGVNTLGAVKAAEAANRSGVRFFCYASSGNVYQPAFHALAEDHPVRRDDPYALSKVMAEEVLSLFQDGMTTLSGRFFGVFGPGQKTMLPIRLLELIHKNEEIILEPAPGEQAENGGLTVSFSYVDDTVACLVRLAELALRGAALPGILNVAGPEPISLRQFASAIGRMIGVEPRFRCVERQRKFDLIADIRQLREVVNPTFTPLHEAMAETYGRFCTR